MFVQVMANMNPPFLPQNQGPFGQQGEYAVTRTPTPRQGPPHDLCVSAAPQVPSAGEHFGQVDVESLLSKLISTGIIKPSQPDPALPVSSGESAGRRLLQAFSFCFNNRCHLLQSLLRPPHLHLSPRRRRNRRWRRTTSRTSPASASSP